ncbi:hypothetical protein GN156_18140 [bacterium LRH843]|nr:hypothetical protein [bacterium LRH843]
MSHFTRICRLYQIVLLAARRSANLLGYLRLGMEDVHEKTLERSPRDGNGSALRAVGGEEDRFAAYL